MIELGTIRKTARAEIRFTVENCQGLEIVTARAWYRDDAGGYQPCAHGLAFRLDRLGAVLGALRAAGKGVSP